MSAVPGALSKMFKNAVPAIFKILGLSFRTPFLILVFRAFFVHFTVYTLEGAFTHDRGSSRGALAFFQERRSDFFSQFWERRSERRSINDKGSPGGNPPRSASMSKSIDSCVIFIYDDLQVSTKFIIKLFFRYQILFCFSHGGYNDIAYFDMSK